MLGLVLLGAGIGLIATARLALVVAGTPPATWLQEYVRLADPSAATDARLAARAASLSGVIPDPMLYPAQMAPCGSRGEADPKCLAIIDAALKTAPASGDLWFYKAWTLMRNGDFSDKLLDALRNSYRVAPREGWIASGRVVLGMKIYPILPDDLQADARNDLALVVEAGQLAQPLASAYLADEALRNAAAEPIKALPAELIERFVRRVRQTIRTQ